MSGAGVRVGVGTRFRYDGETVEMAEMAEMAAATAGNEMVLKDGRGRIRRLTLGEFPLSDRTQVVPDQPGPEAHDVEEIASVVLGQLQRDERLQILDPAEHIRKLLTGFRSGSSDLRWEEEPRHEYSPGGPMEPEYAAQAKELGIHVRTVKLWTADFRRHGEAGLAAKNQRSSGAAASG